MDALNFCGRVALGLVFSHLVFWTPSLAAGFRTRNFVVQTQDPQLAKAIALAAEEFRETLAIRWLGRPLPDWRQPCPIVARVSPRIPSSGATSFVFHNDQPHDWQMTIEGSAERVLDSVLPHEITHTIFATYFGCPLPRWADEGACTTVENPSERTKHYQLLYDFLKTNRGIPFNQMVAMWEYPPDMLPLYAQGHAVVDYLLQQGGHGTFVKFLEDGLQTQDWNSALRTNYRYRDLSDLQLRWVDWVRDGRPALPPQAPGTGASQLAAAPAANGASWYASQRNRQAPVNPGLSVAALGPTAPRNSQGFREIANVLPGPPVPAVPGGQGGRWSSTRLSEPQGVSVQIMEWDGPQHPSTPAANPRVTVPNYARQPQPAVQVWR